MRFYSPGPKATAPGCERTKDKSTRQTIAGRTARSASRVCRGANGNISCVVFAKPNGNYAGAKGLGVKVNLSKAGSRFVLQFFDLSDTQIDGNVLVTGGLGNLPGVLAGKALLAPHFYVRMGDLTDQAQDGGVGAGNAVVMTIK